MIRDPSDGSVREKPEIRENPALSRKVESVQTSMTSALSPIDAKELEKLNKSREWLKSYHRKGISEND
jgi:hypothetical protein